MNSVNFGNSKILYKVKKSNRRKTSKIIVDSFGVQVISPKNKNIKEINSLVKSNSKWIFKKQLLTKDKKIQKITFQNGTKIPYLGKNYLLEIKVIKGEESFLLRNGKFFAKINNTSKPKLRKLYIEWSKLKMLPILKKSVEKYSKKIGVKTNKILIKNQQNRWGSLSKKGTLNFNQNLIRAPTKIIDYVVAHEICHLKIPTHSRKYWSLLESVLWDYEERKEWLRDNRMLLFD